MPQCRPLPELISNALFALHAQPKAAPLAPVYERTGVSLLGLFAVCLATGPRRLLPEDPQEDDGRNEPSLFTLRAPINAINVQSAPEKLNQNKFARVEQPREA
jgi:hypothetical protein